jgi:hypothetical protein
MSSSRRAFLNVLGAGAASLGALPAALHALSGPDGLPPLRAALNANADQKAATPYDLTWPAKLTTKHRAVFDVAAIDSGFGVWRTSLWAQQYMEFMGAKATDISSVLIMRADGISLAMQQKYWDAYHVGKTKGVKHPITEQPTDRNPVLLSSARKEVPPDFDAVALDQYIKRGGIALACDLAFREVVYVIEKADKIKTDDARKKAVSLLVPGVMLQPSGIFAVVRAQEAGAQYVRAS